MSGDDKVHPLVGNQLAAVRPGDTVWLSASAGTGKTQVLSSRVLRLLLEPGVGPSQVLCLTFTKAGAAEMAGRINDRLARWVRLDDVTLALELKAIGADFGAKSLERARTLFAAVLDCPGGGLRIDTIHAFSQWLLGAFPLESGLTPGTRAMEERERDLLARQVLADLLVHAEDDPLDDPQLLAALGDLSLRLGPDAVEAWLMRCAQARAAWFGPGGWQAQDMRANVLRLLGLPADFGADHLARACADEAFPIEALRCCLAAYGQWNGKKGQAGRVIIADWLAASPAVRVAASGELFKVLFTQKDTIRDQASLEKFEEWFGDAAQQVLDAMLGLRDLRTLLDMVEWLVPALRLGRAFAIAWDEAKAREGLIDFDDQIRMAAELLGNSAMADWIRYKLDRRFDHILVDEAQDTNAAQWDIIFAMAGEFWAGLGQHDGGQREAALRTLFVVGDYKQAIFRFQGTSPENFRRAADRVRREMAGAAANARDLRGAERARSLRELGLDESFRTGQPVLDFVDRAIAAIGWKSFGLAEEPEPHLGAARTGHVALWRPVGYRDEADELADAEEEPDEGQEGWLSRPERRLAENIARQVRAWLDAGYVLSKGGKRAARPGDVMVLVRKRGDLAGLIVARLHAAGVPVAGVDRLRLGAPLAVQDLAGALRFAVQPLDDLNLAALLVSPLVGWTQEQLLEHGYRDKDERLWAHLRRSSHPLVAATLGQLGELLRLADFEPPQALLHWLLVGPWQGRQRLVARLGREANDPIDELLNAAHAYVATGTPSLAGFLAWFDAGEGEVKREAGAGGDQVRVLTVHGSKGLQAPIVILADATGAPGSNRGPSLDLPDPRDARRLIPLPGLPREARVGRIAEQRALADKADMEEHWRLLYVAMTRAEEALYVGGALGRKAKGAPPEDSWYARLQLLFGADDWQYDPVWGERGRLDWGDAPSFTARGAESERLPLPEPKPRWLVSPPPEEPRPPRPLAPSSLGEDLASDPPWPPGGSAEAARRGVLVHRLLERLPDVPPQARAAAGERWLARNAAAVDAQTREEMLSAALAVLDDARFAALFAPGSLAEVPIAATVGGRVIAGTIDRLLVTAERVLLVDYKTARRPPAGLDDVPVAVLRQMAAYVAALGEVYPGRTIEAALLYTAGPRLIVLPSEVIDRHKQALALPE